MKNLLYFPHSRDFEVEELENLARSYNLFKRPRILPKKVFKIIFAENYYGSRKENPPGFYFRDDYILECVGNNFIFTRENEFPFLFKNNLSKRKKEGSNKKTIYAVTTFGGSDEKNILLYKEPIAEIKYFFKEEFLYGFRFLADKYSKILNSKDSLFLFSENYYSLVMDEKFLGAEISFTGFLDEFKEKNYLIHLVSEEDLCEKYYYVE